MVVSPTTFWVGVDAVTTAWVFALRHKSFSFLALAMFFPGIAALGVEATAGDLPAFLRSAVFGVPGTSATALLVSIVLGLALPHVAVHACAALSIGMGWGTRQVGAEPRGAGAVHGHNAEVVAGFLRAAGEEVGWRCWLLPRLVRTQGRMGAFGVSGLAWGLFHVAVMVLLVRVRGLVYVCQVVCLYMYVGMYERINV